MTTAQRPAAPVRRPATTHRTTVSAAAGGRGAVRPLLAGARMREGAGVSAEEEARPLWPNRHLTDGRLVISAHAGPPAERSGWDRFVDASADWLAWCGREWRGPGRGRQDRPGGAPGVVHRRGGGSLGPAR